MTAHVIPEMPLYRIYLPKDESLKDLRQALRKERYDELTLENDHLVVRTHLHPDVVRRAVLAHRLATATFQRIAFCGQFIYLSKADDEPGDTTRVALLQQPDSIAINLIWEMVREDFDIDRRHEDALVFIRKETA